MSGGEEGCEEDGREAPVLGEYRAALRQLHSGGDALSEVFWECRVSESVLCLLIHSIVIPTNKSTHIHMGNRTVERAPSSS